MSWLLLFDRRPHIVIQCRPDGSFNLQWFNTGSRWETTKAAEQLTLTEGGRDYFYRCAFKAIPFKHIDRYLPHHQVRALQEIYNENQAQHSL